MADEPKALCPNCGSPAVYRYGRTRAGKQRFICLMCGRQFIPGSERHFPDKRPLCPICGAPMHLYRRARKQTTFRCSAYPVCRTFTRIVIPRDPNIRRNEK
ncbi:MAG TPA: topoisomerase DNA-binding C4 zinc finger domain-containing protein [Syntrophorhabdales bacterium]|nr:topoisomerase DNA-binding C4 zinc finger domain-containing protein [Syntrophorhabdales bacterium]